MNPGLEKALMLVEKHHVYSTPSYPHLHEILLQEGLLVKFFSFNGGITGVYCRTFDGIELLTLKNGLGETELKHMLAYGLAFHCLSSAPALSAYIKVMRDCPKQGFDDDVENFASILLVPPQVRLDYDRITPDEVISLARISEALAKRRINIARWFRI
ncbi:MAG: hypothetical protein HQP61_08920 [Peptococcaceae bacterium]|nr:hypothetical protein [Candidatus Syntrophopropionicum ammoniitolerans]